MKLHKLFHLLSLMALVTGCGGLQQPVVVNVTAATADGPATLAQALLGRWAVPVPPTATPMPQPPTVVPTVTAPGPTPTFPLFNNNMSGVPVEPQTDGPTPNLNCFLYSGHLEFFSDGVYAGSPGIWPGGAYTVTAEGRLRLTQMGSGVGAYAFQISGDELSIVANSSCTMIYRWAP